MTVPIALVTVTASYLTPDGGPAVGAVTFTPSITPATTGVIVPAPIAVTLVDGELSVDLYSTDDPDWAAPGWTYTVTERIHGSRPRTYSIEVPSATPTLDLALVAPVVDPLTATAYLLVSQLGAALGVASLDAAGQVPLDQLGNAPGGGAGDPSSTVAAETSYGTASLAGVATTYSRGDHTHGTPALGTSGSTAAAGNHAHAGVYEPAGTVAAHEADITAVHGIADTSALATASSVASAVSAHESDTTSVHGIVDTSALSLTSHNHSGTYQPLDADLTTIAGLTATTDNMIQSVGSAWASRTPAQVKTALALDNVTNTSDASKPVSTAQQTALDLKANLASPTFTGTVAGITATMVGAIASTLPDAKGDVLTATAADAPARLAVGANDTVLTADSTTATGLKWAAAAGGGGTDYKVAAKPLTGKWYRAPGVGPVGSNLTMTLNRLYLVPFRLAATTTFDRIGIDVATAAGATGVCRLGIFQADASGDFPGTLTLDAGTVDVTSTGGKTITISQSLSAGVHWLGVVNQTAGTAVLRALTSYDPLIPYFSGASMFTGTTAPASIFANTITGALAGTPTIVDNDNGPIIGLRAA